MESRGAFVDRPVSIALFERLYVRDEAEAGPLPIVVAYGPAGSGRTRLLDYLYARGKDPLTCARVRVSPSGGPRSLPDLLHEIKVELAEDPHPQCGRISFPRYDLGKWMRDTAVEVGPHPDHEKLRTRLARLLNLRFRAPSDAGHAAQNIFVVILQWLVELLLPAFLAQPSIIRPLLWGRVRNTGFVWYERQQRDVELPKNRHMGDVIRKVCALIGSDDSADRAAVDELLVSAFLDDLRAAYDPEETSLARLRTAYCVVLVDDIDLLPDADGLRLLDLVAARRAHGGRQDPLLLVVTSQRRWSHPGADTHRPPDAPHTEDTEHGADPAAAAEEAHTAWLDTLHRSRHQGRYPTSALFLPLRLARLTRTETRRLVVPARRRPPPESEEILAEEIFQATHGHLLAIHLVREALARRRPGAPVLGIRGLMAARPVDPLDGMPGESIDQTLLDAFLAPIADRLDPRVLAACALPRALDVPTVHALLDLPEHDTGRIRAAEVCEELARYAFTEVARDGRLVLHPLLRDLLVRELAGDDDHTWPLSFSRTQARLADHFGAVAEGRPEAIVDYLYHELAAGRIHPVLRRLPELAQPENPAWRADLLAVARAPSSYRSSGRFVAELRERARRLHLRRGDDPTGELLLLTHRLYSPTSNTAWTADLLESLAQAVRDVAGGDRPDGRDTPSERTARLVRPFEHGGDESPHDEVGPLVRTDEDVPFPCPRRTSRRGLWRAAAVIALLAPIVAYLLAYRAHSVETCGPAGPLDVWSVITDRVVDDGLHVRHTGPRGRGPCVGVTDGDGYLFSDDTRRVQRAIADQNEQVMKAAAETGRPYVTAVVMTTLTAPDAEPSRQARAGRSELEGVYLAQQRYNEAGYVPMLRVLVANSGPDAGHAAEVARQIVRAADDRHDPSIVAVLGMGHGTDATLRATQIFDEAGLPVIASAASSDAFRSASSRFFRVAAPNRRQAAIAAAYAKRKLDAETAIVIHDRTDGYSRNLATEFTRSFTDDEHRMLYLGPLTYDASDPEATNVLATQVARACLQGPDVIFYAGRADEADTLLNAIIEPPCDPSITIIGGHALSLLELPPAPERVPEIRSPIYYTATADPTVWRPGQAPPFFRDFRAYLATGGQPPGEDEARSNPRAALAYDATSVLTSALALAPNAADVDEFVVWRRVGLTTGAYSVVGASGVIDFGAQPDGDPRQKAVMLMRFDQYGRSQWIGACGQVAVNPDITASPPEQIHCPEPG